MYEVILMREKNRKQTRLLVATLIVIPIGILVLFTVLFFTNKMEEEMHTQLVQNLKDVAHQNEIALKNQIHSNELLLKGLASELVSDTDQAETVMQYQRFVEEYGLKRLGFCQTDGMTVSTDGATTNLSRRDFFKRGMQGKSSVSGVLQDAMSDEHGNVTVMSIPMKDEAGQVQGVACMTYDSDAFNDSLQMRSFDGEGCSFAVNENGSIMVSPCNDKLELAANFSNMLAANPKNSDSVKEMWQKLRAGNKASGILYLNEADYYYAIPVPLMDGDVTWYMFTVVPKNYFDQRLDTVRETLYRMDAIVIVCILAGVFLTVGIFRKQRREAMRLAYTDSLTGGANFAKFCFVMGALRNRQGYLISLDIQNFSNINIAAGRAAGDAMIMDTWKVLQDAARSNETAARVQEDHFILFLAEKNKEKLLDRVDRITKQIHALAKNMQVPGVYPKYGIYELKENESVEDGYMKAQTACNYLKSDRTKCYMFYDEINHDEMLEEQSMEERFDEALAAREFEVWYQPKYSADGAEIVGSEALVRWRNKDGSMVSPGRFIPLFEKNGMIARLDEYMFRSVCRQQSLWKRQGYHILPVSVNLSRASLYYSDLVEKYGNILKEYQLEPEYVQIEVTETAMEGKNDILDVLGKFRNMGVRILMDDFGTGYSSLAVLSMKCFDTLKLDTSLIDHVGEENGETLLYHVICMGQQMGLHITAEGVENDKQLVYLQKLHCDDIQGFLFARPMPTGEYESLLVHGIDTNN